MKNYKKYLDFKLNETKEFDILYNIIEKDDINSLKNYIDTGKDIDIKNDNIMETEMKNHALIFGSFDIFKIFADNVSYTVDDIKSLILQMHHPYMTNDEKEIKRLLKRFDYLINIDSSLIETYLDQTISTLKDYEYFKENNHISIIESLMGFGLLKKVEYKLAKNTAIKDFNL